MGGATTDFATTQLEHARNVGKETSDLGSDPGQTLGQTLHFWGWLSQREPSSHGQSCHLGRLWTHWEGGSLSHSIALTTVIHPQHLLPPARPSLLSAFATGWQIPGMPRALGSSQLSCLRADQEKCSIPTTHWGTRASHRCRGTLFIHNAHSSQHFPCRVPAP